MSKSPQLARRRRLKLAFLPETQPLEQRQLLTLNLSMIPQLPPTAYVGTGVRDLASFSFTTGTISDYSGSISWGDGTTSSATLVAAPDGSAHVLGGHTYLGAGSDIVAVTVTGRGDSGSSSEPVQVTDLGSGSSGSSSSSSSSSYGYGYGSGSSSSSSSYGYGYGYGSSVSLGGTVIEPARGQSTPTALAVISGASSSSASNFTASIAWGDGTTTSGAVVAASTGNGQFLITGSHAYATTGTYTTSVTVNDNSGHSYSASGKAVVGNPILTASTTNVSGTVGQPLTGTVATVADATSGSIAGSLMAEITWGDGHVTAGLLTDDPTSGFDVVGTNIYGTAGSFPIMVQVSDLAGNTVTTSGTATVSELPLSAFGQPLALTAGCSYTGLIATVINPNPGAQAAQLSATITWGDGTTSAGTIVADAAGGGKFNVNGTKTYARSGTYTVSVQISDQAGTQTSASSTAVVVGQSLTTSGKTVSAVEGTAFTATVASFTTGNTQAMSADFTTTVWWGDGSATTGTVVDSGGQFNVSGTHTYAVNGTYAIGIQVSDGNGIGSVVTGTVNVADAALTATGRTVSAGEGTTFSGTVATFTDANPLASLSQYTATITWGDGQTSQGTVQTDPGGGGVYDVVGTNLYSSTGSYALSVQVRDAGGSQATVSGTANVTASATAVVAPAFYAMAGQAFNGRVTTFTRPGTYNPGDFTATITWGDGTSSSGTIASTGTIGQFALSGTHTYASVGSYAVTATVTLNAGSGGTAVATGTAGVSQMAATGTSVTATAGTAWSGTLATLTDSNLALTAASFITAITWGDGTTSAGTVTGSAGQFTIAGSHTYAAAGTPTATVQITDPSNRVTVATAQAVVSDTAVTVTAISVAATEGVAFNGNVVTFTGGNAQAGAGYFGAVISWGDGTASAGTVTATATAGQFSVSGMHTYALPGSYPVSAQVISQGGSTGSASTTATVSSAPLVSQPTSISALTGVSFSGTVATFTKAPADPASEFTATITWGDGTITTGTIVVPPPQGGPFRVAGAHTYSTPGTYPVSVHVVDVNGSSTTASSSAQVADIAGTIVAAWPVVGTPFLGNIATFSGPGAGAAGNSATISWGDGTTSAGTITPDPAVPGLFDIAGTHTYAAVGVAAVSVHITDAAGSITLAGTTSVVAAPLVVSPASFNATTNTPFSGPVARFTGGSGTASGDTASVDWGDGTTSSGIITVATTPGGANVIAGTHAYAALGTYTVTVTVAQPDGTSATSVGTVSVTNMTVTGSAISVMEGTPFSGVVATFTNPGSGLTAASYKAIINWGDGHVTGGTISNDPAGGGKLDVSGSLTYTDPGSETIAVQVVDPSGRVTVIYASATVADAPLSATGVPVMATLGTTFTGTVATFTDGNPTPNLYNLRATVTWGDGSTTVGQIMADPATAGQYEVVGTHTYQASGTRPVSVLITDTGGSTASATTTATVSGVALSLRFGSVQAQVGAAFSGTVASFGAWSSATAGGFSATIAWGDGTTSTGTITAPSVAGNPFTVGGGHTYAASGVYQVVVTVGGSAQGTVTGTANVSSVTATGSTFTAVVGAAFSGTVASFGDPSGNHTATDYQAVITWGDGNSTPGIVSAASGGGFTVTGTHTYAAVGTYATSMGILQPTGATLTTTGSVTVVAAPLVVAPASLTATAGSAFSGVVTQFSGGSGALTGVTATIAWGDGTTTSGTIAGPAVPGGANTVSGSHTYATLGSYAVTVTVVDATAGVTRSMTGSASVSDITAAGTTMYDTVEGSTFYGNVATFRSANSSLYSTSFAATINWGDGTSSAGSVSMNYMGGGFNVSGSHAYAMSGSYHPTVRITEPGGYAATATSTIRVTDASMSLTGASPSAAPGVVFTGTVATLVDGNTLAPASEFTASILWSDGTTTAGAVVADSSGPGRFNIRASRIFDQTGTYTAGVTLLDATGNVLTTNGSVNVTAPALAVTVVPVSAGTGIGFDGLVARFTASATAAASAFAVTVNWGDGTSSAGTVTAPAVAGGPFLVTGEHTYSATGSFSVSVSVTGPTGTASGTGTATVSSLYVAGRPVTATAGSGFSGTVATFVDTSSSASLSSTTATITWGDGQSTSGRIVPDPSTPGVYDVIGDHTYGRFGTYTIGIAVSDNVRSGSTTATASVADAPLNAYGTTITATEGATFTTTVATFLDRATGALPADFSVTIAWGDGQVSSGTVVVDPAGGGYFDVSGTHVYKTTGSMSIGVSILDAGGSRASASSSASVADAALAATTATITPTEGASFTGVVATFNDANPYAVASDFTATVDWGDGTSGTAQVTGDTTHGFSVTATQTYTSSGTFPVLVQIKDGGGSSVAARSTAVVADAPLYAATTPAIVRPTEGASFSDVVASFTDANPSESASAFTATITWGDGTTSTGTVAANDTGGFDVSGTHTYIHAGNYPLSVHIADAGGSTLNVSTTAQVADAVLTGQSQRLQGVQGTAFSGLVAVFSDADPNGTASHYTASINWGDGTITSGTITDDANQFSTFDVNASHTYAYASTYPITVVVSDADGQSVQVASTITVSSTNVVTGMAYQNAAGAVNTAVNGSGDTNTSSFDLGVGSFVPPTSTSSTGGGSGSSSSSGSLALTAGAPAPVNTSYSHVFKIHKVGPNYVFDEIATVSYSVVVTATSFVESFTLTTWSHFHETVNFVMGTFTQSSSYDEIDTTSDSMSAAGTFTTAGNQTTITGSYNTTESTGSTWMLTQSSGGGAGGIGIGGTSGTFFTAGGSNSTTTSDGGHFSSTGSTASVSGSDTVNNTSSCNYSIVTTSSMAAAGGFSVTSVSTSSGMGSEGYSGTEFYSQSTGGAAAAAGMGNAWMNGNDRATSLAIQTGGGGFGMATGSAGDNYSANTRVSVGQLGSIETTSDLTNLTFGGNYTAKVMASGPFSQGGSSGTFTYSADASGSSNLTMLDSTTTTGASSFESNTIRNGTNSFSSTNFSVMGSYASGSGSGTFTASSFNQNSTGANATDFVTTVNGSLFANGNYSSSSNGATSDISNVSGMFANPGNVGTFSQFSLNSSNSSDTCSGGFMSAPNSYSGGGTGISTSIVTSAGSYTDSGTASSVSSGTVSTDRYTHSSGGNSTTNTVSVDNFSSSNTGYSDSGSIVITFGGSSSSSSSDIGSVVSGSYSGTDNITYQSSSNGGGSYG